MNIKKYLTIITSLFYIYSTSIFVYAWEENNWLLLWVWTWETARERIRTWDLHTKDIPNIIKSLIDIFLWLAWTIAVIFVIIWAYKLLFGSLKSDHTKWRETIVMAITGFAISVLAWFIVKFVFNNFS